MENFRVDSCVQSKTKIRPIENLGQEKISPHS